MTDLNQLPIPDWNLTCPRCNYSLNGLPEHRCPECGLAFEMEKIVCTWTRLREPRITGDTRPFPILGVQCPHCSAALDGLTTRNCAGCHLPITAEILQPRSKWLLVERGTIPAGAIEQCLAADHIPYAAGNSATLQDLYFGPGQRSELFVPSEFHLDLLVALANLRRDLAENARLAPLDVTCTVCSESNPGNFEFCWNCRNSLKTTTQE